MKKLDVASLDLSGKINTIEHIFDNMHAKADGLGQAGYILGGDTGVGKTSFIRDMATLLGLELIIIETPHIVEEHIIDIPFIVVKPGKSSKTEHMAVDTKGSAQEFDIKFAKSNLYMQLVNAERTPDSAMLSAIYRRPDLVLIWEKLGGTKDAIPGEIRALRKKFKVVLFLDEYFRQASNSIRNMLRSILNGRIGSNTLPDDAYVIFASNLVDQGVGDILENEDFRMLNFDKPSTDEWFAYFLSKYKNNKKVPLHEGFMTRIYNIIKKHTAVAHDDEDADVRISPRRWEQLLVYINSNLPVKDQKQADLLMKNVEVNFKNYQTGDRAKLAKEVLEALAEEIKKESKIETSEANIDDSDWRETLKHQVETKIRVGGDRKYIPVIGGLPGAGKTKHITDLATDLNLVPVFVDVQNLSPEEVIGTPLAKGEVKADTDIEVTFSRPPLFDNIQEQMKKGEANLKERLEKFNGKDKGAELFDKWKKADYKYLIFFDELNRTNTKVFNAIRKVLLEREFNDEYKLPEDAVIVAAINPTGKGTVELTKHVRDVFDVIPVGISWAKFQAHLDKLDLKVDKEVAEIARSALKAFVEHFRAKGGKQQNADPHFFLNLGATPLYVSAREYTDLLINSARSISRAYAREIEKMADPEHDAGSSEFVIRQAMARAYMHSLEYTIGVKHGMDSPETMKLIEEFLLYDDKISLGGMFKTKVKSVKSLEEILSKSFDKMEDDLFNDLEFVNYVTSVEPVVFQEELTEFLKTKIYKDAKEAFAKTSKLKKLDVKSKKTKLQAQEVSKIEFITREILHAIKLHDISNKMLEMVKLSLRDLLRSIAKENKGAIGDVMGFNKEITAFITELSK